MGHHLRPCPDQDHRPGPEHALPPLPDPPADGAAGSAGLWWLWDLVELRLSQAEPDSAA
jgi:hypothetical protein